MLLWRERLQNQHTGITISGELREVLTKTKC